jgi:hypothetical protein
LTGLKIPNQVEQPVFRVSHGDKSIHVRHQTLLLA